MSNTSHITIEDQRGQRLSPIKNRPIGLRKNVNDTAKFNNMQEGDDDNDSYTAYHDIVKNMDK